MKAAKTIKDITDKVGSNLISLRNLLKSIDKKFNREYHMEEERSIRLSRIEDKLSYLHLIQKERIIINVRGDKYELPKKVIDECKYNSVLADPDFIKANSFRGELQLDVNTDHFELILFILKEETHTKAIEESKKKRWENYIHDNCAMKDNLKESLSAVFTNKTDIQEICKSFGINQTQ